MKNKTKAQLIEELGESKLETIMSFDLLKAQHRKIKRLKRIVKRDAKDRIDYKLLKDTFKKSLELERKYHDRELKAYKVVDKINKQALTSCENANQEFKNINRYLEQRVSELTIMLHESDKYLGGD